MKRIGVLAVALAIAGAAHAGGFLDKPRGEPAFLPVNEAFEIQPLERKDDKVVVSWRIAPGYYLYRSRLSFKNRGSGKLGSPKLPAGARHEDEYFGVTEIYRGDFLRVELPVEGTAPKQFKLEVGYQGCAEAGLCYPPQTRVLEGEP